MKSLTVFDPAAADNTGAGDSTPVPELIRFASDAEWLKRKGVAVERWNLVSDPMEFALNHRVSMFLKRHGAEDLPYILVNGAPVLYGRYPTRAELAGWFGVSLKPTPEDCAAAASPQETTIRLGVPRRGAPPLRDPRDTGNGIRHRAPVPRPRPENAFLYRERRVRQNLSRRGRGRSR